VRDRWSCPVCGRSGLLVKIDREVSYAIRGGSIYVCKRCAKHRRKEIEEHNAIYWGDHTRKKDPNCKHEWVHPYPGRWYCPKCSAEFNFTCGCGGSMYVCEKHYQEFIKHAEPLDKFLAENSW